MKMRKRKLEKKTIFSLVICLALALIVACAAIFVRIPSSFFKGNPESIREAYIADDDFPYLTDMDSYYYARKVDDYLTYGRLGDSVAEDGSAWDTLSNYPEGRSADIPPGLVWLTAWISKISGINVATLEYYLAAAVSAFAALIAFMIGCRMSGIPGGFLAGVLVGCAPQYAARTCFGRFDTDMLLIPIELLLILFAVEAFRTRVVWKRLLFVLFFALTAALFTICWTPGYALLFVSLTMFGCMLYTLVVMIYRKKEPGVISVRHDLLIFAAGIMLTVICVSLTVGISVFINMFSAFSFSTSTSAGEGAIPNLMESVAELNRAGFFPRSISDIFSGYVSGEYPAIINGIGGILVMVFSLLGLIWLLLPCINQYRMIKCNKNSSQIKSKGSVKSNGKKTDSDGSFGLFRLKDSYLRVSVSALYLSVLGTWLLAGLYLAYRGVRFIEHTSIPSGLLAGSFAGQMIRTVFGNRNQKTDNTRLKKKEKSEHLKKQVVTLAICIILVIPVISGAYNAVSDVRPSSTDSSLNAMEYIKNNAKDKSSVIASWWDMGYFYESESKHPCLWDGGTQVGERAIMVAKALITDDMELSRRIWIMLSCSGNAALEKLQEYTDIEDAFDILWNVLPLEKEDSIEKLKACTGMTDSDAAVIEGLMHPDQPKETYLIITYTMTQQIGWYEYYAGWDFTGKQELPSATLYSYTPDGTPLFNTVEGLAYLDKTRGNEVMWRLFFNAEQTECFTPAFEWHDGLEHVRVWRVEP